MGRTFVSNRLLLPPVFYYLVICRLLQSAINVVFCLVLFFVSFLSAVAVDLVFQEKGIEKEISAFDIFHPGGVCSTRSIDSQRHT
jgi:hypothetical protein